MLFFASLQEPLLVNVFFLFYSYNVCDFIFGPIVIVLAGFVMFPNGCELIARFSSCNTSGKRHFMSKDLLVEV